MEKFCECNSEWILGARAKDGQVALDCTQEKAYLSWKEYQAQYTNCPICEFWPWYDAQYENMLFDLREMNQS